MKVLLHKSGFWTECEGFLFGKGTPFKIKIVLLDDTILKPYLCLIEKNDSFSMIPISQTIRVSHTKTMIC